MKNRAYLLLFPLFAATIPSATDAAETRQQQATQGTTFLSVAGTNTGAVRDLEGGAIGAEIVRESNGAKHLGAMHYDSVKFRVDFQQGKPVWDWVSATIAGSAAKKNVALTNCDFSLNAISQRDFQNSLLTEVAFPTLDAASKDPGWINLSFQPEAARSKAASGKCNAPNASARTKAFMPNNFKLELVGLETSYVNKVEGLTFKQEVSATTTGQSREPALHPSKVEMPNLKVTLSVLHADTWTAWHDDFVVKGNNGNDREKTGAIVFLAADMKEEVARIALTGVGIYSLGPSPDGDHLEAGIYAETMRFSIKGK
jgi:hypothetical protein